jgi:hypothetical protein
MADGRALVVFVAQWAAIAEFFVRPDKTGLFVLPGAYWVWTGVLLLPIVVQISAAASDKTKNPNRLARKPSNG